MARKTTEITVTAEGRDKGKHFFLKEMPCSQAEKWAIRAFMGMAKAGLQVPEDIKAMGIVGVAIMGMTAFARIPYDEAEPLLDEMMQCVGVVPDPSRPNVVRALIEDDIEEVATRLMLRKELIELHTGFFSYASRLESEAAAEAGNTPAT